MRRALILFVLIAMSACHHPLDCATEFVPHDDCLPGTAGYESAQKRLQQAAVLAKQQESDDDKACQSLGLKVGTSEYSKCRDEMLARRVSQVNAGPSR